MSQAFHGGRLVDAEREFGLSRDQFIDFSSNLNVFAPSISAGEWERWISHICHYPEADLGPHGLRSEGHTCTRA